MPLSMGWRECDRLPPHPQADHRGARRGWECQAKTNGTPREGQGLAFATALLSELLGPPNFHNTVILDRGTLPHKGQESKTARRNAKEGWGHKNTVNST